MDMKLRFLYGLKAGLDGAAKVPGQVLICTDTCEMFVDLADGSRIQIADLSELESAVATLTGTVEDLAEYIGQLPEGSTAKTIVEYISEKTTGVATEADLAELQEAVDAKFAEYTTTTAQEAIDAAQDAKIKAITDDYVKAADIANFETKENVKKVADDLAAMYTNEQIDNLIQGAKDYADTNDADTKYGIEYDSANKKIKLVEGGATVEIDATAFIKDGMIDTVVLDENNDLVITFNTEAGKDAIVLPLDKLIDVYTGKATDDIIVTTEGNEISATLTAAVKASLAKADAADANAQGYANTAEQNAKDYADSLADNYADAEHDHVTADITDFAGAVKVIKVDAAVNADEATKATQDGNGRVIADTYAEKATTLEGYGITDAYTKDETTNLDTTVLAEAQQYADQAEADAISAASTDAQTKVDALANGQVATNAADIAALKDSATWGTF